MQQGQWGDALWLATGEPISILVLLAAKVLGGAFANLGGEASVITLERALAGSWQLGVCHSPVADFGPGFSSLGDNDAHLTQTEGK